MSATKIIQANSKVFQKGGLLEVLKADSKRDKSAVEKINVGKSAVIKSGNIKQIKTNFHNSTSNVDNLKKEGQEFKKEVFHQGVKSGNMPDSSPVAFNQYDIKIEQQPIASSSFMRHFASCIKWKIVNTKENFQNTWSFSKDYALKSIDDKITQIKGIDYSSLVGNGKYGLIAGISAAVPMLFIYTQKDHGQTILEKISASISELPLLKNMNLKINSYHCAVMGATGLIGGFIGYKTFIYASEYLSAYGNKWNYDFKAHSDQNSLESSVQANQDWMQKPYGEDLAYCC